MEYFAKKLAWRYAKGVPKATRSRVFLGDSTKLLAEMQGTLCRRGLTKPKLLLTSPPYFGITNYHYDQWLRLWLLGGPPTDRRTETYYRGKHRGKFENIAVYQRMLDSVFESASRLMKDDAVIYVRTDRREPTLSTTKSVMKRSFPHHILETKSQPLRGTTQTGLFGHFAPRSGDVDLILMPS
jgi:hypothetical protein